MLALQYGLSDGIYIKAYCYSQLLLHIAVSSCYDDVIVRVCYLVCFGNLFMYLEFSNNQLFINQHIQHLVSRYFP